MKLIDKDALLAEIKKRKEKCELFYNIALSNNAEFAKLAIEEQKKRYDSFKGFINSLEVKEVDLEKELESWMRYNTDSADFFDVSELAKHFFELGLKAQKGE